MVTPVEDSLLRNASIEWLRDRTHDGLLTIDATELADDFYFQGQRRPLKNPQAGIHSSRGFRAAWTITTAFREPGKERPYDDAPGPDKLLRYKWQGSDPESPNNRALRKSMELRLPVIWFWGVAPGVYKAIFPVFLVDEEATKQQFVVATDGLQNLESAGEQPSELLKEYRERIVRERVHQPVFRERVLRAYQTQCAICSLPRPELLDAAHIVADKEPDGIASVPNGMALCKIHHSAYDNDLLSVTPDYEVVLREDLLEVMDGPVFEHGLKAAHGNRLRVFPARKEAWPDAALLAQRYDRFLSAPRAPRRLPDFGFPDTNRLR